MAFAAGAPQGFIGRLRELAALRSLLQSARLVTLTGTGGIGKTCLAARLADGWQRKHPGGVIFIDLAPLAEAEYVPPTVAIAVGVSVEPVASLTARVAAALQAKDALL